MARLERGESEIIDRINDLVSTAKNCDDICVRNSSIAELLQLFKPLILKLCKKWSEYFNDSKHNIKRFDELVADAEYWFMYYTLYKYDVDGSATFNTFIRNHLDQRIRYIYECELKYYNKHIFPDPDKRSDTEVDSFESVAYNYSSDMQYNSNMEDDIINGGEINNRAKLAYMIFNIVNSNGIFNERERVIFISIICNGETQNDVSKRLGISRTRITQLIKKIKSKLYKIMNSDEEIWEMVNKLDIDFKEM